MELLKKNLLEYDFDLWLAIRVPLASTGGLSGHLSGMSRGDLFKYHIQEGSIENLCELWLAIGVYLAITEELSKHLRGMAKGSLLKYDTQ